MTAVALVALAILIVLVDVIATNSVSLERSGSESWALASLFGYAVAAALAFTSLGMSLS